MTIDQSARDAAATALRDAARVIERANVDWLTDYEIKSLCPEIVGSAVTAPQGVMEYLNRRADEIQAGGPLTVMEDE